MRTFLLLSLLAAVIQLWFVDKRLERLTLLKQQAQIAEEIYEHQEQLARLESEIQEALADPNMQIAIENLGYQRNFKKTRQMAQDYLRTEEGPRVEDFEDELPLW